MTNNGNEKIVRMPKTFILMCVILLAISIKFVQLYYKSYDRTLIFISAFFACCGIVCFLGYYSLKIEYDETTFVVKRYFGQPICYAYDDILGVIVGIGRYTLVTRSSQVKVDVLAKGKLEFY